MDTGLYHLLPLEVGWWFLWRCGVQPGNWVVLVTNKPNIVGSLAVRAGVGISILWGLSEVEVDDTADLTPYVDALQAQVRVADGLPPVHWNQSSQPSPPCQVLHGGRVLQVSEAILFQFRIGVFIYAHMRVLWIQRAYARTFRFSSKACGQVRVIVSILSSDVGRFRCHMGFV